MSLFVTKKRVLFLLMWRNSNLSLNLAFVRNDPHATSTAGWWLIIFPYGMPACVTPRGTFQSPKGSLVHTYNCENFVFFRTYLFVRALLGKTISTPTREARPDTLVEVWARSEHYSSRGKRSKFFSAGSVYERRFPGFLCVRPILYVRTGNILSVFVTLSNEHTAQDIHHRYTTEHAESTTLQRCRP